MNKIKTHDKILELLDGRPMTALEILNRLKSKIRIVRSGLYTHLDRAVAKKKIGFLWNKDKRTQGWEARKIIMEGYDLADGVTKGIKWPEKSERIYFRTKNSEKLYKKLMRRYSKNKLNDDIINNILDDYRALEVRAVYNKNLLTDPLLVRKRLKKNKKDFSQGAVNQYIQKVKIDCNLTYRKRKKWLKIKLFKVQEYEIGGERFFKFEDKEYSLKELQESLNQIAFDKWMNFLAMLDVKDTKGQSYKERAKILTNRMMDRMSGLFLKIHP